MAKQVSIKPEEQLARSYADRLILEKLTEMEEAVKLGELADKLSGAGIGLAAVRSLLASNADRFAYHERRWIPAARLQSQGRPLAEAVAITLHRFGGPMAFPLLRAEVSRIRRQPEEVVEPILRRMIERDRTFVPLADDQVVLASLGFVAHDEPRDRAFALNGVKGEDVEALQAKLGDLDFREPTAVAEAVRKTAPVSLKTLGAAAYFALSLRDFRGVLMYDAREFLQAALAVPGYVLSADGTLHPEAEAAKWVSAAVKLADRLAPDVEVEDAAPIEVKSEDIDRLLAKILGNESSTTAYRLLEENYEITPANKTFPDDLTNLMTALKVQAAVQWVGGDRFRKANDVPEFIHEVPEPFHFAPTENTDEEGELVDVELTDDGLSSTLRKLLQHPLAVDVMDEDIQPAPKTMPETLRLVLKSIHRELGTFPLAQVPTGWLEPEPKLQELIFRDPSGRETQVWVNTEARLMYNLFDLWFEQPIENGAVFTITKTPRPNVLDFEWLDQPDPVVYISNQRMEELRQIGAESEGKSILALLIEVMAHWPKGADYLTLLAELNVVRRASRRLVASLLSSYQCFYQRSGSPVWHFDPKKVELGFDKTKRKFVKK